MARLTFRIERGEDIDFELDADVVTLGRDEDNAIVIRNSWVSAHHLRFERDEDGRFQVIDLNSSNGVEVNGRRITRHTLADGDIVQLGLVEAVFTEGAASKAASHAGAASPSRAAVPEDEARREEEGARLEARLADLHARIARAEAVAAEVEEAFRELEETRATLARLRDEIAGEEQRRRELGAETARLADERAALEASVEKARREERETRESVAALEESLAVRDGLAAELATLRDELAGLGTRRDELLAECAKHARRAGAAPDLTWETIHRFAKHLIRKIDLLDDLIAKVHHDHDDDGLVDQLESLREALLDILREYSVEAFRFDPGTLLDIPTRKRIVIIGKGSHADPGEGAPNGSTHITATIRPGYLCRNGRRGTQTLLRKAEVRIA